MKRAAVFFADGFEDVEALSPVDYMRRAGIDVVTVGVRAILVVSPDMKDSTVTELIKTVIDNSEELNKDIVTDGKIDGEAAVLSVGIPFHPAAAAYLETMGVHVAKWTGKAKKTVIGSQDN